MTKFNISVVSDTVCPWVSFTLSLVHYRYYQQFSCLNDTTDHYPSATLVERSLTSPYPCTSGPTPTPRIASPPPGIPFTSIRTPRPPASTSATFTSKNLARREPPPSLNDSNPSAMKSGSILALAGRRAQRGTRIG